MMLELAKAERLLIAQIVNIKLDSATLRDHILLEDIFHAVKPFEIKVPMPPDFVSREDKHLFEKYENKRLAEIEDEDHKKILSEAVRKAKEEETKLYTQLDETEGVEFSHEQIKTLKDFFEHDQRPFPREYHEAIISLHSKLNA